MANKKALTLETIKKSQAHAPTKSRSLLDFADEKELKEWRQKRVERKRKKKKFDAVDSISAEILARFGWEAYQAWNNGEISQEQMTRWLFAERSREREGLTQLESVIFASFGLLGKKGRSVAGKINKVLEQNQKIINGD